MSEARRLILLGAGGLARETAEAVAAGSAALQVHGFLDDAAHLRGARIGGVAVLGPTSQASTQSSMTGDNIVFVATVASPREPARRRRLVERLGLSADRWATVVHPSVQLARSTSLGRGSILLAACVTTADVSVGEHVVLMPGCILTHDVVVSDFATLASGVRLSGAVQVGTCAYLGAGAVVREALSIGAGAVVGMGSVVTRNVPAGETWAGVPARRLRPADHS